LTQTASYTVIANKLYSEYDRNEVAADEKYKGKIIIVSGAIHDIGKDVMNNAYIVIGGKGFLDGVQCTFTKGEQSSVARLSKGQQVTVKGEVGGKMGNVLVNKASLQ
jgi:tRNA_anti-like